MNLAQKIKQARERAGMTQKEAACSMGISQQAYSQYESGRRVPKAETLGRIALALGITTDELFDAEDLPPQDMLSFLAGMAAQSETELKSSLTQNIEEDVHRAQLVADQLSTSLHPSCTEQLLSAFMRLNQEGQKKAVERVQELAEVPRYCVNATDQGQLRPAGTEADKDSTHE